MFKRWIVQAGVGLMLLGGGLSAAVACATDSYRSKPSLAM